MTIGQLLKSFRVQQNLSQPDLSSMANIEQSYLSKLENDKSIPSNEIFSSLLAALNVKVGEFVSLDDYQQNRQQFDQIDCVKQHFADRIQLTKQAQQKFILLCLVAFALGVAFLGSGWKTLLFNEEVYVYESHGVVHEGEPLDLFDKPVGAMIDHSQEDFVQQTRRLSYELNQRRLTAYDTHTDYQGPSYTKSVNGGVRNFSYDFTKVVPRTINGVLQFLGVFLIVAGLSGFVLERRLFR